MCEGRKVPLDFRGSKRVRGEMCEYPSEDSYSFLD